MRDFLLNKLECFNDPDFIFDPGLHKYTYHGDVFQSVTQLVGQFHLPFDTEGKSKKKADDTGFDQEWIKAVFDTFKVFINIFSHIFNLNQSNFFITRSNMYQISTTNFKSPLF